MKNKEYEQLPKKDSKSLHLILGIVIGAVIATAIILVVLFATGVIGGKGSEETATTTAATNSLEISDAEKNTKPSDEKTPSASEGKYKEFKIENITVIHKDIVGRNDYSTTESRIVQIPYMKEFEEIGLDLDELVINVQGFTVSSDGNWSWVRITFDTQQNFMMTIMCSGSEIMYDNIFTVAFEGGFPDPDTGGGWINAQYFGTDELLYKFVFTDSENKIGYGLTNSGYSFKNGTYYDNNGNIITEKAWQEEFVRIREEATANMYSQLNIS